MNDAFWNFFTQNGSVEAYLLYRSVLENSVHTPPDKEPASESTAQGIGYPGDAGG
jgi:hypothetical protein